MNRRSFLKGILACSIAPYYLPNGGRLWKAVPEVPEFNTFKIEWIDLMSDAGKSVSYALGGGLWHEQNEVVKGVDVGRVSGSRSETLVWKVKWSPGESSAGKWEIIQV